MSIRKENNCHHSRTDLIQLRIVCKHMNLKTMKSHRDQVVIQLNKVKKETQTSSSLVHKTITLKLLIILTILLHLQMQILSPIIK